MANRSTVKSNIITKNVPTVTNAILTDMLNGELADNIRFREDVATLQSSSVSNITVDFTGKDRVDLTRTGGSLNITLSGVGDGETKFLLITKTAGQAVTFVGVTDVTPVKANANAQSIVLYEIVRKSSYYFAKAWVENVKSATDTIEGVLETATQAESNGLSVTNKIVTPGRQPIASTSQRGLTELATSAEVDAGTAGNLAVIASELKRKYDAALAYTNTSIANREAWQTGTLEAGWSGTIKYFRDLSGNVHIKGYSLSHAAFSGTAGIILFTIPVGYRSDDSNGYSWIFGAFQIGAETQLHRVYISSNGVVVQPSPDDWDGSHFLSFYIVFRGA